VTKFSVLLPTRNRLELLRQAVETVRRQSHSDWEIVISDNASEDDVEAFVTDLADSRVTYLRQRSAISVTDNWNCALDASSGRWVIMLGDDDGLMPGALKRFSELVTADDPDVVYANAYLFTHPGVVATIPDGSLEPYGSGSLFDGHSQPYVLDRSSARDLVRKAMKFEMAYTFNMQHSLVRRDLIDKLRVGSRFFHSPYPDFYATNALFLAAERILICPDRLVVVGLSPKSFGYYFFNDREGEGEAFLRNSLTPSEFEAISRVVLPGSADRTSWLAAMEALKSNFSDTRGLSIDHGRYRRLQLLTVFGGGRASAADPELKAEVVRRLRPPERLLFVPAIRFGAYVMSLLPRGARESARRALHRLIGRTPTIHTGRGRPFQDLIDVFDEAERRTEVL
jgi:glycosyltransferase involved in cell wall biosynthesis